MPAIAQSARIWAPIAIVWVLIDQLAKQWALNTLNDRTIELVGDAELVLAFNSGMAFGRGQGLGPVIGVAAFFVIGFLVISIGRQGGRLMQVAVGLIVGGALGNVIDRMFREQAWFRGRVVDYIRVFDWFPIFNIADIGITVGGALLLLTSITASNPQAHDETATVTADR